MITRFADYVLRVESDNDRYMAQAYVRLGNAWKALERYAHKDSVVRAELWNEETKTLLASYQRRGN